MTLEPATPVPADRGGLSLGGELTIRRVACVPVVDGNGAFLWFDVWAAGPKPQGGIRSVSWMWTHVHRDAKAEVILTLRRQAEREQSGCSVTAAFAVVVDGFASDRKDDILSSSSPPEG